MNHKDTQIYNIKKSKERKKFEIQALTASWKAQLPIFCYGLA